MTNLERAKDIYNLIGQGKLLDAFEKYYDENVIMHELGDAPRVGKTFNRQFEQNFLSSIKEMHGGGVLGMASDEASGKVYVENWMDVTYQNGVRVNIRQVCAQTWKDGLVIREEFYHNLFPMSNKMTTQAFEG